MKMPAFLSENGHGKIQIARHRRYRWKGNAAKVHELDLGAAGFLRKPKRR